MSNLSASVSLKFNNLPKLLGQSNYILWANAWKVAFRANRWWSIISGELKKPTAKGKEGTSSSESTSTSKSEITIDNWEVVNAQAHHMHNAAVDHTIQPNIATLDTAANAWQALKDLYNREMPNTTITILKTVLNRKLEDGASMHEHLTNFNNDWSRL